MKDGFSKMTPPLCGFGRKQKKTVRSSVEGQAVRNARRRSKPPKGIREIDGVFQSSMPEILGLALVFFPQKDEESELCLPAFLAGARL